MCRIKPNELIEMYVVKQMSLNDIATYFGYKSGTTISNILRENNISIRNSRDAQRPIELDVDIINQLYIDKEYSISDIASKYKCGEETVRRFLIRNNINRRDKTHKMAGWNKGLTKETDERIAIYAKSLSILKLNGHEPAPKKYGITWHRQRRLCLIRDNHTCQACGNTEKLHVHHWEPYRFCYNNELNNLVTLCAECHRELHQDYKDENFTIEAEFEFYGE